ncbi:MAG TPA: SDR family oxidoreductase [Vicinamibacterales bacterium]|nr:SDR family oxidoreductase [Vicinamibacterales bacterium]
MGRMNGKVAIVTGATSGMGHGTSLLFAREGAAVLANGRDAERGRALVEEIRGFGGRAEFVPGDATLPETGDRLVRACVAAFGQLDAVVCAAGVLGLGSVTEVPLETWRATLAINLDAVFYLLRSALPVMQAGGGGSVVVVGSIAAFKAFPNHAAYCASKSALVGLVRQTAIDYGPQVRINLLCPGPVDTPFIWASAVAFPDPADAVAAAGRKTVLERLGTPADIARAALFLASDESGWVTGTTLTIDGGAMTGGR